MNGKRAARGGWMLRLEGVLEIESAWHVGTGQRLSIDTDAPLLLEDDGRPYLPGSSIRGVLHDLVDREACLLGCGRAELANLFGATEEQGAGDRASGPRQGKARQKAAGATGDESEEPYDQQGRLTISDARAKADRPATLVRDHVCMEHDRGAAKDGGKFDLEMAGRTLLVFVLTYEGDGPDDRELLLLKAAVEALRGGDLAFGGKRGWGHGFATLRNERWSVVDRSTAAGLSAYLAGRLPGSGATLPWSPVSPWDFSSIRITSSTRATATGGSPPPPASGSAGLPGEALKPWHSMRLELVLNFEGPLLVSGPLRTQHEGLEREADHVFFRDESGRYTLPGSSLRGMLRHESLRLEEAKSVPRDTTDLLFGTTRGAGLIACSDSIIERASTVRLEHVAIDRLTGFAADAKLFDEVVLVSPVVPITLRLRWHDDQRAAVRLLLHLLRDLRDGWLWCGGRTTRGAGHVAKASVTSARISTVRPDRSGREARILENPSLGTLAAALGYINGATLQASNAS